MQISENKKPELLSDQKSALLLTGTTCPASRCREM
jgi:hypothetical protein